MTTLMDPVSIEAPTRGRVRPASPLDPSWDNNSETRSLERSFEVASRGGFARTVVGRLAYFDEDSQTYMVLTRDGTLARVPLRDITSSRGVSRSGPIIADALSKMSRLRNATTVSRP
jgi:hypothetical protein